MGKASAAFDLIHFELLFLLGAEKTIRLDVLAELLGVSLARARTAFKVCADLGLVRGREFLKEDSTPWLWLKRVGEHPVDLGGRYAFEPSRGQLLHQWAVSKVRLLSGEKWPGWLWISERELSVMHGRCKRHLADALLVRGKKTIAIEVELTHKDPVKLVKILKELCEQHHKVYYFCSPVTKSIVESLKKKYDLKNLCIFDAPEFPEHPEYA